MVGAGLALAILGFVPGMLDPFAGPKADVLAILGLGGLAAILVEAWGRRPRPSPLDVAVLAWCAVAVASALAGISPRLSWLGEAGQREGLRTTLALAGCYALARRAHREVAAARTTHDVVLLAAVAAAGYALIQCSGHDPLHWANVATYAAGGRSVVRPASTVGNATALGTVLAAALALAGARLAGGRGERAVLVPASALLGVALLATLSRGALLGAAAGMLVALAGAWRMRRAGRAGRAVIALAAPALPAAAWGLLVLRAPLAARAAEGMGGESSPVRIEIAHSAVALWRAHPWLGVGPDAFALAFPRVQTAALWSHEWLGAPAHAHSVPLQVLATGGVAAVAVGLAWLGFSGAALVRGCRDSNEQGEIAWEALAVLAALAVCALFNPPGLAGAALFVVFSAHGLPGGFHGAGEVHGSPRPSRAAWVAGAVVALLVAAFSLGGALAAFDAARARAALGAIAVAPGEVRLALARSAARAAQRAVARNAGNEALWRLACDARLACADAALTLQDVAGFGDACAHAELAARRAVAIEPARAGNHERLANALAMRARADETADGMVAAEAEYAVASRLAPMDALILVEESRAQLLTRRYARAAATASRIVALYPGAAHGHALAAAALAAMGWRDDALVEADRALAARWEDGSGAQRRATQELRRALAAGGP